MGFASEYLSDRVLYESFITDRPHNDLAIIVIIPACNEPDIITTIDSLATCSKPDCGIEVIVHVNAGPTAGTRELEANLKTIEDLKSREKVSNLPFRLFCFNSGQENSRGWGAGLARKVVMDEAVRRFNEINKPEGLIVSLDADCEVEDNYFSALYNDFYLKPDRSACSIYFEHPVDGSEFEPGHYLAITRYELHLRYYYQALRYSQFPEVFHTVGSAIAVRAKNYVRSGGMNRKQAGEDFYFIQKNIPMGGYFYLNTTKVIPSPRMSGRVPFGTGPAIKEILGTEDNSLYTYNLKAFSNLKVLFSNITSLYYSDNKKETDTLIPGLDNLTLDFLRREGWADKLVEIRSNTANLKSFTKRFFSWFNMFKVVKYLNYLHNERGLEKVGIESAARDLLLEMGRDVKIDNLKDLLKYYRMLEIEAI